MSLTSHIESGKRVVLRAAVITCSDTRDKNSDLSGAFILDCLREGDHEVIGYSVIKDEPALIQGEVRTWVAKGADVVLINGGTGIASRDTTFEALALLFDRSIPGFGELFRMLSYEEIGAASMLSRAQAGLIGKTLVFSMPGSRGAVRLAMTSLIMPQVGHMVSEIKK